MAAQPLTMLNVLCLFFWTMSFQSSEALLSLTTRNAAAVSVSTQQQQHQRQVSNESTVLHKTPLRYRSLKHENDPAITFSLPQVPLTFVLESTTDPTTRQQKQQQQAQDVSSTAAAPAAMASLTNKRSMDEYLDSIDRRYRRLYDVHEGHALVTIFPSIQKQKRKNRIRVFIAFIFHQCCCSWSSPPTHTHRNHD